MKVDALMEEKQRKRRAKAEAWLDLDVREGLFFSIYK
jgi:hypothetical protein